MKYCRKCGVELQEDARTCDKCGFTEEIGVKEDKIIPISPIFQGTFMGFLWAFFVGIIGLIIAIIKGDEKCQKSAFITFIIITVIGGIAALIFSSILLVAFNHVMDGLRMMQNS